MKFINTVISIIPFCFLFALLFLSHHAKAKSKLIESTYIVHMDNSLVPKAFTSHHNWYSSIIDSLRFANNMSSTHDQLSPSILYTYKNALQGFSAVLSLSQLEDLKKHRGFILATKDSITTSATTYSSKFLSLVHSTGLWASSNYGKGIIIGVIDSGVWPENPSFQDHGMIREKPSRWKGSCDDAGQGFNSSHCNFKLIGAKYFNKGLLSSNKSININYVNSARDTRGHGTVVSTIAAGNFVDEVSYFGYGGGISSGIAPQAMLAIYKVVWDNDSAFFSDIVLAVDEAIDDGVDVINISLHDFGIPLAKNGIAVASFSAMEKGIFVSCAAGNEGPQLATMHNGIPWVTTVTAGSTDRWFAGTLTLGRELRITGWSVFPGLVPIKDVPLIYEETLSACNSSKLLSQLHGKIIICKGRYIVDLFKVIISSEIQGAIIISDVFDYPSETPCSCIIIRSKDAPAVLEYVYVRSNDKPSATMEFHQTIMGIQPAPTVPHFASRGPSRTNSNILKPDIMAPGVYVVASSTQKQPVAHMGYYPLYDTYTLTSGTSLASAHLSGVAALLKSAHPEWSPAAIRSAIMTTANTLDNTGKPIQNDNNLLGFASPLDTGTGYIDPNRALDPGLIYDATRQDYVNLLCSMKLKSKEMESIIRSKNYKCPNSYSFQLNYPSFIALYKPSSSSWMLTQYFERTVTNVGKGSATYKAVVIPPLDSTVTVSPSTLVFRETNEKQNYTLSIEYKGTKIVSFGSLEWVEIDGPHSVRSPIVVTLDLEIPHDRD